MRSIVLSCCAFIVVLASCSDANRTSPNNSVNTKKPFVFSMNSMFTDAERYVSFPVWFNDSIISAQKIKKITRELSLIDEESEKVPRERREYFFDRNGQLELFKISYIFDDEEIGSVAFLYKTDKDKNGFSVAYRMSDSLKGNYPEDEQTEFSYQLHQFVKQTTKYLAYEEMFSGNYLFCLANKKHWGPLSVDSIIGPSPEDEIILGTTKKPYKKYRVRNKVNERDIQLFTYDQTQQMPLTINRMEHPFEIRRSVHYNEKGICTGFIDSTFTNGKFLTRRIANFQLDKKNKPVRVSNFKENQKDIQRKLSIEKITYEYFN